MPVTRHSLAAEASTSAPLRVMNETAMEIRKLEPPILSAPIHHYVHKKNVSIIPRLESAIRALSEQRLLGS